MVNMRGKRMSTEKFCKMFFDISETLSRENKKMKYTDWLDLRAIAIGRKECCNSEVTVALKNGDIYISCPICLDVIKKVCHEETAEEIFDYLVDDSCAHEGAKRFLGETKEQIVVTDAFGRQRLVDKDNKKVYNNNITNNKNIKGEKENDTMMNTNKMFKGLDFGKANKEDFRLSHLGLAVKNSEGTFVSYDKANEQLIDVDLFDFDLDGMIYKMPVAHNQVQVGDVVLHNGTPVIVSNCNTAKLEVIDPVAGTEVKILPTKNMFGFNFFTKVLCLMDMNNLGASSDNPFGNMMPFMMMSAMKDGDGNNDMMSMMMMMSMMGGNNSMGDMFSNPMMMMAMMSGDGNMKDMMPMMMMMQGGMFQAPSINVETPSMNEKTVENLEKEIERLTKEIKSAEETK